MSATTSSRPFRLAIVGCGRIANAHLQAVLATPDAELAALVDPVEGRARALADRYGVDVPVHARVADALPHVDGAVIATPNHLHAEPALACIEAGVATLIEKPLAASAADGRRICDAARAANVVAAVGYVTRFRENVQLMRDLLRRGAFGRALRFVYQFGTRGGWAPLSAYNLDSRAAGGGVLVVSGTHFIDRALDWFGYPSRAALRDDSRGGPEANAVVTLEFDHPQGTITGIARFSKTVALEAGIVLETDGGIVVLRDRPDASVVFRSRQTPHVESALTARRTPPDVKRPGEFVLQLENFIRAARGSGEPMVSASDGLASLRLLESLYGERQPLAGDGHVLVPEMVRT